VQFWTLTFSDIREENYNQRHNLIVVCGIKMLTWLLYYSSTKLKFIAILDSYVSDIREEIIIKA
jgi:hypothetical protein